MAAICNFFSKTNCAQGQQTDGGVVFFCADLVGLFEGGDRRFDHLKKRRLGNINGLLAEFALPLTFFNRQ